MYAIRSYYEKIVYFLALGMTKLMKISGMEALSVAGNIFLGQTEAPLMIKAYLDKMNRSRITSYNVCYTKLLRKLFAQKTKVYLYPSLDANSRLPLLLRDAELPKDIQSIIEYLELNRKIVLLNNAQTRYLSISSEEVARLISANDSAFVKYVPVITSYSIHYTKLYEKWRGYR